MCVCALCSCPWRPKESVRFPWHCSYRWHEPLDGVLGTKPKSSAEAAIALNHWANHLSSTMCFVLLTGYHYGQALMIHQSLRAGVTGTVASLACVLLVLSWMVDSLPCHSILGAGWLDHLHDPRTEPNMLNKHCVQDHLWPRARTQSPSPFC